MTYRELHAALAQTFPVPVGYGALKAEIAKALGTTNPLKVAHTVRELNRLGVVVPTTDSGNALWFVAAVS